MLSNEQKTYFLNKIASIKAQAAVPNNYRILNPLHSWGQHFGDHYGSKTLRNLENFENQLALEELEQLFANNNPDQFKTQLTAFLAKRWERIRGSSLCYTRQPTNVLNELCFELAKTIAPPINTEEEIEALDPLTGPYFLLMPSLKYSEDGSLENIHKFKLHELIMSDDGSACFSIAACLEDASVSDEGKFRYVTILNGEACTHELSATELERVDRHSDQAAFLYQEILSLNQARLLGDDIGPKLGQLATALRGGSASHYGGNGEELDSGSVANEGIAAFSTYWEGLSEQHRAAVLAEAPDLKNLLGRLFRPDHADYQDTRFCVHLLANDLDPIVAQFRNKPQVQELERRSQTEKASLTAALKNPQRLRMRHWGQAPKHILHLIHKLSFPEQEQIFEFDRHKNALWYALAKDPEALLDFELDEESKLDAIEAKVGPQRELGLIIAAYQGKTKVVELLLSWGADIESADSYGSTALHWAAQHGHVKTVSYLLDQGALLDSRGNNDSTALHFAISRGQSAVVDLLLKRGASLTRNRDGYTPFDYALSVHPELVEPLLLHLMTLPAEKQADCLSSVDGGPYSNVLFYAAAHRPQLFQSLMTQYLKQPNLTFEDPIFNTINDRGETPFILAAQLGATKSLQQLLDLGINIESCDDNGSTALHWAAQSGHAKAVESLLNNGAFLESIGRAGNTALHFAVLHQQLAVIALLLQKGARIDVLNTRSRSAFQLALASGNQDLAELFILHLASVPQETQVKCLAQLPGGPYRSIFFYVRAHYPALLHKIVKNIDFLARNEQGLNGLQVTLAEHPELIEYILMEVAKLPLDKQAECLADLPQGPYPNVYVYAARTKPEFLDCLLINRLVSDTPIGSTTIPALLQQIAVQHQIMREKAQSQFAYRRAADITEELLGTCIEGLINLKESKEDREIKLLAFKNTFKEAIEAARPVLSKHRAVFRLVAALLLVILTFPISLPLLAFGVFSLPTKTKSERLLNLMDKQLEDPSLVPAMA